MAQGVYVWGGFAQWVYVLIRSTIYQQLRPLCCRFESDLFSEIGHFENKNLLLENEVEDAGLCTE